MPKTRKTMPGNHALSWPQSLCLTKQMSRPRAKVLDQTSHWGDGFLGQIPTRCLHSPPPHESSEVKGFVRIDHYTSQTGNWTKWEFDANSFEQAMDEVKKLEAHIFNIPSTVNSMPCTKLFALHIVVTPNVGDAFKVVVFLELEKVLNELQVMSVASSKCRIDFEVDKIKRSLKDLKDSAMEKSFLKRLEEIR